MTTQETTPVHLCYDCSFRCRTGTHGPRKFWGSCGKDVPAWRSVLRGDPVTECYAFESLSEYLKREESS